MGEEIVKKIFILGIICLVFLSISAVSANENSSDVGVGSETIVKDIEPQQYNS